MLPQTFDTGKYFLPISWKTVLTDACLSGWEGVVDHLSVQGTWSPQERLMPINVLELRAIPLMLLHWIDLLQGLPVRIQSDSATAVVYVNQQGGSRSQAAQEEVGLILSWAEVHVSVLSALHIPGVENGRADFPDLQGYLPAPGESRSGRFNVKLRDLCPGPEIHRRLQRTPLLTPWDQFSLIYTFPLIQLLLHLLRKIKVAKTPVILVVPGWLGILT